MSIIGVATPFTHWGLTICRIFLVPDALLRCRCSEAKNVTRAQLWLKHHLINERYDLFVKWNWLKVRVSHQNSSHDLCLWVRRSLNAWSCMAHVVVVTLIWPWTLCACDHDNNSLRTCVTLYGQAPCARDHGVSHPWVGVLTHLRPPNQCLLRASSACVIFTFYYLCTWLRPLACRCGLTWSGSSSARRSVWKEGWRWEGGPYTGSWVQRPLYSR